jgi:hypothetical protein
MIRIPSVPFCWSPKHNDSPYKHAFQTTIRDGGSIYQDSMCISLLEGFNLSVDFLIASIVILHSTMQEILLLNLKNSLSQGLSSFFFLEVMLQKLVWQ